MKSARFLSSLATWSSRTALLLAVLAPLAPLSAQSNYDTPYTFRTIAGLPHESADGTGSNARFFSPSGMAVDQAGNTYVADMHNHIIRKITPAGIVTTIAGSAGTSGSADGTGSAARFANPSDLAQDSDGNIYIADMDNQTIRKMTPAGTVTTVAGAAEQGGSTDGTGGAARFLLPTGIAIDGANNLYVSDQGNRTIRKITSAGVVTTLAGAAGIPGSSDGTGSAARFNSTNGLAVNAAGDLFVADTGNHTIRKVTPAGVVTTLAGVAGISGSSDGVAATARFNSPMGVALDSAGNLYVADSANNTIRMVSTLGVVTTIAGLPGLSGSSDGTGANARFDYPQYLAVNAAGNILVADTGNDSIRKITSAGAVSTLAGKGGSEGSTDGAAANARFFGPQNPALDSSGNLYFADVGNGTIRKLSSTGIVTTLAGLAGSFGSTDNTGSNARFMYPWGTAVDRAGNIYVTEFTSYTIRKITPGGTVTTFAGSAGMNGFADGTSGAARFFLPRGVAVDSSDNVYVADSGNNAIRKITPAGVVTTLAGASGFQGTDDGPGSTARFVFPAGVAVDAVGNVYVADYGNDLIRKITPDGFVTTIAGSPHVHGSTDGTASAASFALPTGIAVDGAGNIFVTDISDAIRKITPAGLVTTVAGIPGTAGSSNGSGAAALFNVPTGLAVDSVGTLFVVDRANNTIRKGVPSAGTGPASNANRLINISTRSLVGTGGDVQIAGFVISGSAAKRVVIRASGPVLATNYGVTGVLADPQLELHNQGTGDLVATNDDWDSALAPDFAAVGAFAWNAGSKDAALVTSLNPGMYTVVVKGKNDGTGVALVEVYDADTGTPGSRLINISTRSLVGTSDNVQIAGFVVSGTTAKNLVIRAAGPVLGANYGVAGALADPVLELHNQSTNAIIATNDDWDSALASDFIAVGAFPWTAGSKDAALVTRVDPGQYTVVVKGKNNATGVALVEVYEEP